MPDLIETALETLFLSLVSKPEPSLDSGRCFFLNAHAHPHLSRCGEQHLVCEQTFRPDADQLAAHGIQVVEDISGTFPLGLYLPGRQHDEILWNFARAIDLLEPDGTLVCAMPNELGARRYETLLARLCGTVDSLSKHKCRAFRARKTALLDQEMLAQWRTLGRLRPILDGRFVSAPGLFGWDRIDPGSQLLMDHIPSDISGAGADLGAGFGTLGDFVLRHRPNITALDLYEADRRALDASRLNLNGVSESVRLRWFWHDVMQGLPYGPYDWIVTNPPCHDTNGKFRADIGTGFIRMAAASLKPGGRLWLVANRHLPYESVLVRALSHTECQADTAGYKVLLGRK